MLVLKALDAVGGGDANRVDRCLEGAVGADLKLNSERLPTHEPFRRTIGADQLHTVDMRGARAPGAVISVIRRRARVARSSLGQTPVVFQQHLVGRSVADQLAIAEQNRSIADLLD